MQNSLNSQPASRLRREKVAVPITCTCGQVGSATWEADIQPNRQGPQAILLAVSSGFYERIQVKNYATPEILCAICEAVVTT